MLNCTKQFYVKSYTFLKYELKGKTMRITHEQKESFKKYLIESEHSRSTVSKYMHDISCFEFFAGESNITKQLVLEYKNSLNVKYEISSANSMLAALNAFFRFLGWNDCIVRQFHIQKKAYCDESKELTRKEYERLLKTASKKGNTRLYLLLQTICGTGIRVSELSYFTVEAVRKGRIDIMCKGKARTIFIVVKLKEKLLHYAKQCNIKSGRIFITKSGKSMNRSNIWREMKKLCEEAGVLAKKVFPHNLRHLFARAFYEIEKDISKLADLLGHSSIETTRIYIISSGEEHRRKMENMRLII